MKFCSMGSEQFHADRRVERHRDRRDKAKLTVKFRSLRKCHTREVSCHSYENQTIRDILSICRSWCKVFVTGVPILTEISKCRKCLAKISSMIFQGKLTDSIYAVLRGHSEERTRRHDEASSRYSQLFCRNT
jgi:hypothetical protein